MSAAPKFTPGQDVEVWQPEGGGTWVDGLITHDAGYYRKGQTHGYYVTLRGINGWQAESYLRAKVQQ